METFVHPDFLDTLARSDISRRSAIERCLTKVRNGNWDLGLRVKRLKGFSRRIWEARVDGGDRLIFLFAQVPHSEDHTSVSLNILDVVDHDHVRLMGRRGRSMMSHVLLSLDESNELEADNPDLSAESFSHWQESDWMQEAIELKQLNEYARRYAEVAQDPEETDHSPLAALDLWLTEEQADAALTEGDCLVSGVAGSGKTTMAAMRLLFSAEAGGDFLYLAYSPGLVREAQKLCRQLLPPDSEKNSLVWERLEFRDFDALILGCIPPDKIPSLDQKVRFPEFCSWYEKLREKIPAGTAWSEIRSVIKGANLSPVRDLLDRQAYLDLGKKRAPYLQQERERVYGIAKRYQEWLREKHLYDEIDICRQAFREVSSGKTRNYSGIVCDEVQDLTELQLEIVHRLHQGEGPLFFTGDVNQIIRPSGFRWEEIHAQFHRRNKPQPQQKHLSRNFRGNGRLVAFSEAVLQLRARLVGSPLPTKQVVHDPAGRKPQLVSSGEPALRSHLQHSGLHFVLLVRSEQERASLRRELGSPFVFTVDESKGLEFDHVVVWRFFEPLRELWQKGLRGSLAAKDIPALQQECNLLYVAATRPRKELIFFDPGMAIWGAGELSGTFNPTVPEILDSANTDNVTVEEWNGYGQYYFDSFLFEQAYYCFSRGSDIPKLNHSLALMCRQQKNWKDSGEAYLLCEDFFTAAEMFELALLPRRAAEAYAQAGQEKESLRCEAQGAAAEGQWAVAGELWLKIGDGAKALECAKKTQDTQFITRFSAANFEMHGRSMEAARCYEALQHWTDAARCWERAQKWPEAAEAYLQNEDFQAALSCANRISSSEHKLQLKLEIFVSQGDAAGAVRLVEEQDKLAFGAGVFERLGLTAEADGLKLKLANREQQRKQALKRAEILTGISLNLSRTPRSGRPFNPIDRARERDERQNIRQYPQSAAPHWRLGLIYWANDSPEKAVQEFEKALEKNTSNDFLFTIVTTLGYRQTKCNNSVVHCYLGVSLSEIGQLDEAILNYRAAAQLAPGPKSPNYNREGLLEIYNGLGRALIANGDCDGGIVELCNVLAIEPRDFEAEHNLGMGYFMKGECAIAIVHFEKALAIKPTSEVTRLYRNTVRAQQETGG